MMAGILDFIKTPEGQGLLSAAFGGLAGARRGTPLNNIGRAGLSGLMGYSNAIQSDQKAAEDAVNKKLKNAQIERMTNPHPTYQTVNGTLVKIPSNGTPEPIYTAPEKSTPLPWYVRNNNGTLSIDPAYSELEKAKASSARPPAQPMQPVAYLDANGQPIWGTIAEAKGRPAATYTPSLQGQIAQAKKTGEVTGKETTDAKFNLPSVIAQGDQTIKLVDDLLRSPGISTAVGTSSKLDPRNYVPGTDAYNFRIRLDQIKGQQFMQAYQSLKGGGQITEVEGKKATDAISRMNTSASEQEFKKAAEEFKSVIRQGMERAKNKAGMQSQQNPTLRQEDPLGIR